MARSEEYETTDEDRSSRLTPQPKTSTSRATNQSRAKTSARQQPHQTEARPPLTARKGRATNANSRSPKTPKPRKPFPPARTAAVSDEPAASDGTMGSASGAAASSSSTGAAVTVDPKIFDLGHGGWSEVKGYDMSHTMPELAPGHAVRLPTNALMTTFQVSKQAFPSELFADGHAPSQPTADRTEVQQATETPEPVPSSRARITALYNEASCCEGTQREAFLCAARLEFLTTLGETHWRYQSDEQRQDIVTVADAFLANAGCPQEAANSVLSSIDKLEALKPVNCELSAEDENTADSAEHVALITDLTATLYRLVFEGQVYNNNRRHVLLDQIQQVLDLRVPLAIKTELVAAASTIWPHRKFEANSAAFAQFLDDQEEHLLINGVYDMPADGEISNTLPGVEDYISELVDSEAAEQVLNQAHRTVAPDQDDVEEVKAKHWYWKNRLYDALVSLPENPTEFLLKQWSDWVAKLDRKYDLQKLDAISWMLFNAAVRLHESGCILQGDTSDWCEKDERDSGMQCSERLETMIESLAHKLICTDCLNHQHLLRFVVAPHRVMKQKKMYDRSNGARKASNKQKRETGSEAIEAGDHEEAPEKGSGDEGDNDASPVALKGIGNRKLAARRSAPTAPSKPAPRAKAATPTKLATQAKTAPWASSRQTPASGKKRQHDADPAEAGLAFEIPSKKARSRKQPAADANAGSSSVLTGMDAAGDNSEQLALPLSNGSTRKSLGRKAPGAPSQTSKGSSSGLVDRSAAGGHTEDGPAYRTRKSMADAKRNASTGPSS
ncbi:hypothetical protein LTR36_003795 [Oleoguttula mirabilis]|uniref:Uncharacterized protein n=1 Tax=Oleoguttula mirabilis TaxID=1507867 RepID=A0AAV9JI04_9PEZI|nr:hypothetical protein LTR36_003795 [Oleoguttula mirabilis]